MGAFAPTFRLWIVIRLKRLASPGFYIRQLQHRMAFLEANPELTFDANDMKALLGNVYQEYQHALKTPLDLSQQYPLSLHAQGWAESAEQLLKDVNKALNLRHIVLDRKTEMQRLRAEKFQRQAEELMHQFDNDIRNSPDCIAFTIHEDQSTLAVTEPYYEAQRLLENWVLPRLNKSLDTGTDRLSYAREMQRQFLTEALERLRPPQPEEQSRLDSLREKFKKHQWLD